MMKSNYMLKVSGLCGIILPFFFIIIMIISLNSSPWFSWTENAISDMGRPEFGFQFFNYFLITVGILLLFFSIGLYFSLGKVRFGPTVLGTSSIYFIIVGIFPLPDPFHIDFSGLFFIGFPLGFFILGLHMYKQKSDFLKNMGIFAFAIAFIAVCSPVFLIFYPGIAIPELLILIPGFFWCLRYGLYMIVK